MIPVRFPVEGRVSKGVVLCLGSERVLEVTVDLLVSARLIYAVHEGKYLVKMDNRMQA